MSCRFLFVSVTLYGQHVKYVAIFDSVNLCLMTAAAKQDWCRPEKGHSNATRRRQCNCHWPHHRALNTHIAREAHIQTKTLTFHLCYILDHGGRGAPPMIKNITQLCGTWTHVFCANGTTKWMSQYHSSFCWCQLHCSVGGLHKFKQNSVFLKLWFCLRLQRIL